MNIAMVMSTDRLDQEHAMLNRIVVGLVNDGDQVIRIVPSTTDDESTYEKAVSLAKRISTPMPVSRLLRNVRCEELILQLGKNDIDGIIAFGKDAQQVALDISPHVDAPVLREVISMRQAKQVKKSSKVWRWLAATPSIERCIAQRVGEERVALVPLAAATSNAIESAESESNCCITILDAASNFKSTKLILEALQTKKDIHVFVELTGRHQHKIWKVIKELKMLDRVTCLRDMAALRSLIVQSDVVLVPSQTMPVRTVLLEVMLASIPIIAAKIDGFDMLIDEETALIVDESWEEPLQRIFEDQILAKRISEAGAHLVATQYASSTQIAAFEASFTLF
ncbi:MAG: glycosyltransferase [Phycisphaerales bacterium]|nr:glycosyltransferase [Planctomycetota bacterium]MBL6997572.1 glycosyltransferase [Phycisphaerales bacterium]